MRTHIYTAKEREAIRMWLSGDLNRRESVRLNSALLRTNKNRVNLIADIHLFTTTLKELSASPKRITPDGLTTHVFIAPIPVRAHDVGVYTKEIRTLKEAERNANDESAPTSDRLASAEDCIRIARAKLTGAHSRNRPDTLHSEISQLTKISHITQESNPTMSVAGNSEEAKKQVATILKRYGWRDVIDLGGVKEALSLEMMLPTWMSLGNVLEDDIFAFRILREEK